MGKGGKNEVGGGDMGGGGGRWNEGQQTRAPILKLPPAGGPSGPQLPHVSNGVGEGVELGELQSRVTKQSWQTAARGSPCARPCEKCFIEPGRLRSHRERSPSVTLLLERSRDWAQRSCTTGPRPHSCTWQSGSGLCFSHVTYSLRWRPFKALNKCQVLAPCLSRFFLPESFGSTFNKLQSFGCCAA